VSCVRRFTGQKGFFMSRRYQPLNARHAAALAEHASRMRTSLTPSEQLLWAQLAGGKLGVGFRRQYVVGKFVVDFAAPSRRLAVEVDGSYHATRGASDAARDAKLARLGWRVVRIPAASIMRNVAEVVEAIRCALQAQP
jgi:very-short-patch-repair endonuclease